MKMAMALRSIRESAGMIQNFDDTEEVPPPIHEALSTISSWARDHTKPEDDRSAIDQLLPGAARNESFFKDMAEKTGDYEDDERDVTDIYNESPLEVTRKGDVIKVLESTGGPADGYKVTVDEDFEITKVLYWFAPWGDYAEMRITNDDYPFTFRYLEYTIMGAEREDDE